ncbi:hypothetical protein QEH59_00185 [Coraliomargarita sp. SDUM461004]|uniref:Uncharacterized protein n=1 Tax=Thalassobacterium sedimentorum TaxID=3041258 RepID=A0ABU1AG70_9BACT|nr:hypothetical protein [Coraliomargarita sp. SDUM461004]MDQ8192820.1 hypothetical protein [Coraliomargarita sp. SDUM461004]
MIQRLSTKGEHYFFGYYDLPAWDSTGQRHLAHKVPFTNKIPQAHDIAELGFFEAETQVFRKIAATKAWNFQQGAMLQWLPQSEDLMIFNTRQGAQYQAAIYDSHGQQTAQLPAPIANVDPKGRFALSINFSRLLAFRPGYGYAGLPDPFATQAQPEEDGIFRIDFDSNQKSLILSLKDLGELCRPYFGTNKILVNHLNLNPSGTRFVALVRNFPTEPNTSNKTIAITANADGSQAYILWDGGVASHYHWKTDTVISMVIKDDQGRITVAEFIDQTPNYTLLNPEFFLDDGHQSYSPDLKHLLYDSYPIDSQRDLYLYNLETKKGCCLETLLSAPIDNSIALETRCDLHPRWHPSGQRISFDSIHQGYRGIYTLNLNLKQPLS